MVGCRRALLYLPVVLYMVLALAAALVEGEQEDGFVTLLTEESFDAFIRVHEFSMVELCAPHYPTRCPLLRFACSRVNSERLTCVL